MRNLRLLATAMTAAGLVFVLASGCSTLEKPLPDGYKWCMSFDGVKGKPVYAEDEEEAEEEVDVGSGSGCACVEKKVHKKLEKGEGESGYQESWEIVRDCAIEECKELVWAQNLDPINCEQVTEGQGVFQDGTCYFGAGCGFAELPTDGR